MNVLLRKLLREASGGVGWLLLAIASIMALGIACFIAMRTSYFNLKLAQADYYRETRIADFWIDLKKAPLAEIERLKRLPGVLDVQSRVSFYATVDVSEQSRALDGLVLSLPERRQPVLNDVLIRSGDYFTPRRENEVIVNEAFAKAHYLYPGSRIHLLVNNRREEFFVVGTALSSEFVYLLAPGAIMPDPDNFGVFYIKRSYAEDLFDFQGAANQVVGRLSGPAADNPDLALDRAEDLLEPYGVFTTTPLEFQASNQYLTSEIEGLWGFAIVLPGVFLAVAAIVLNVLMTRMARQQRTVIGTLKALGYTDGEIFWHFMQFGLLVGLVGAIGGSLLGFALAEGMTIQYRVFYELPNLGNHLYVGTHAIGLAISLAAASAGSAYGAWSMLQLSPAEAMRPEPPPLGGAIWLERIGFLWERFDAGWRMALRGIFRNSGRSLATVFATMMGASLVVTGLMFRDSALYLVDFQFQRVQRSDLEIAFKQEQPLGVVRDFQLPGVDLAEPVFQVAATLAHGHRQRKLAITGLIPSAQLSVPRDGSGNPIARPRDGIVLTRTLAEALDVRQGDSLRITPVKGDRRSVEAPVRAIADSYFGLAAYADLEYLSRLIGETPAATNLQLRLDGDAEHERQLHQRLKRLPGVEAMTDRRDMVAALTEMLDQNMGVFVGMYIVFAGVVFFGALVNAAMVSLQEREREIATLLALGYTPWQVGNLLLREMMTLNLGGAILGLPAGYGLVAGMSESFGNDLVRLPVVASWQVYVGTMALAVLFGLAAQAVVQWRIFALDVRESLNVKE